VTLKDGWILEPGRDKWVKVVQSRPCQHLPARHRIDIAGECYTTID
jgi:hypothetical protein